MVRDFNKKNSVDEGIADIFKGVKTQAQSRALE